MPAATAAAGAGATPTAAAGAGAADTPRRHANRTPTEPATSAGVILPENGQFLLLCSLQLWQQLQRCQTRPRAPLFSYAFYFRSAETVRRERHVSEGNEQLQASARVKKLAAVVVARPEYSVPATNTGYYYYYDYDYFLVFI